MKKIKEIVEDYVATMLKESSPETIVNVIKERDDIIAELDETERLWLMAENRKGPRKASKKAE